MVPKFIADAFEAVMLVWDKAAEWWDRVRNR